MENAAGMKSTTPKKKALITVAVILLAAAVVCAAVILALKIKAEKEEEQRQAIINSGTFHNGITVGGVDVSGMSMEEAAEALKVSEAALTADVGFTLTDGTNSYEAPVSCFTITYDTADKLNEAMQLAREGTLDELLAELDDIETNGRSFDISYEVTADFSGFVSEIANALYVAPTDATFSVKPLEMNDETDAQNAVNIGLPAAAEGADPGDIRDLRFDFVEGIDGVYLDQEALLGTLASRLEAREYGEVSFETQPLAPEVTIATIKENLVLRSSAYTSYGSGHYARPSRVHNMTKACGLIYGTILQPGDVLSCNTLLGNRYEKYGWQLAPAVIEGGANTEDQPGGGVCQVSTTMYNAVLKGDYTIVYRQAHSSRLSYVDGGLDATINTGTIDFKWSNNTQSPVYVFTWIDTDKKLIWCEIYGEPFASTFDEIELVSERKPDIAPTADEFIQVTWLSAPYWALKNAAKTGYVYDTYKVYKLNGEVVDKVFITTTTYKMHPNRYFVWTGYVPGTPLDAMYKIVIEPTA